MSKKLEVVESAVLFLKQGDTDAFEDLNHSLFPGFFRLINGQLVAKPDKQKNSENVSASTESLLKALDVCQANVMLADEDCKITYVNASVVQMLKNNDKYLF